MKLFGRLFGDTEEEGVVGGKSGKFKKFAFFEKWIIIFTIFSKNKK
ncbi:MAG: hypothetical protein LBC61_05660 [Candidatus Peribacteria bacterium]|nr:hypothetical protein [Candidatus Peribacteria bacterium]